MALLLTLLQDQAPKYPSTVGNHIAEVVSSIQPVKRPSLIKDVARKALYHVLYEIIEDEPPNSPSNMAIGRALANAITGQTTNNSNIGALCDKLRADVIAALTPQP